MKLDIIFEIQRQAIATTQYQSNFLIELKSHRQAIKLFMGLTINEQEECFKCGNKRTRETKWRLWPIFAKNSVGLSAN